MSFGDDTLAPEDGEVTRLKADLQRIREENERLREQAGETESLYRDTLHELGKLLDNHERPSDTEMMSLLRRVNREFEQETLSLWSEINKLKTQHDTFKEENERLQRLLSQCEQDFQAVGKHADAMDAEATQCKAQHDALLARIRDRDVMLKLLNVCMREAAQLDTFEPEEVIYSALVTYLLPD